MPKIKGNGEKTEFVNPKEDENEIKVFAYFH